MRRETPVARNGHTLWPSGPLLEESVSVLAWGWVVGYSDEMNFLITKGSLRVVFNRVAARCLTLSGVLRMARLYPFGSPNEAVIVFAGRAICRAAAKCAGPARAVS